jgi:hypothetical protein
MSSTTAIDTQPSEALTYRKQAPLNEVKHELNTDTKSDSKSSEFSHSFPIHTKPASSILSKENNEPLSFRGFGNLGCKLLLVSALPLSDDYQCS